MTPKLRAWDNGMEMMVYQGDDEIYICFDGEKWKLLDYYRTHWETDEYGMNEIEQPWEVENIEIMQWTGLKASNGVEIYEGDIIREDIEKGGPPIIVSVVWEDGAFYGKERTHNPEYLIKEFLNGKVIGNIYENPELLEG